MRRYRPTYFLAQAIKGLWRNRMMSLASITVLISCLIVMGCFMMLLVNIDTNLDSIGDLNEIVALVYSENKYVASVERPVPTKVEADGNVFLGWSTDPDATVPEFTDKYTVDASHAVGDSITLYAVWQNKAQYSNVKVEFNTLGIAVTELPVDSGSYVIGDTVSIPAVVPKNPSIKFLGWSLSPVSDGTYISTDSYVIGNDDVKGGKITFYAIWDQMPIYNEFSLVYDTNGVNTTESPSDAALILESVGGSIKALSNIDKVDFISKSDALEEEIKKYEDYPGLQQFLSEGNNPLPDTFVITYKDNSQVEALELQIENIDGVSKVRCRADIAESIENMKSGVIVVFTWFMIILLVVSVFVIINTVKLAVEHRREDISIMRYIGATRWFIALPFELEGIIIGILSGIVAFMTQGYIYGYVRDMITSDMQMIEVVPFSEMKVLLFFGCLIIGVVTGFIGSVISINKNLNA